MAAARKSVDQFRAKENTHTKIIVTGDETKHMNQITINAVEA